MMKLGRRFVNIVAEDWKRSVYSLHRLDVSKHLFYPSTSEAEAAKKPVVDRLPELPAPIMDFYPSTESLSSFSAPCLFALMGPRGSSDGKILFSDSEGNAVRYEADSQTVVTMPHLKVAMGDSPIAISIPRPGPEEEEEEEDLYVMSCKNGLSCGRYSLDVVRHRKSSPPSRGCWQSNDLPPPPFRGRIDSHTVVDDGRTICVSASPRNGGAAIGTYCFDTRNGGGWRQAGDWVLPFLGRAEHVPELNTWLGFCSDSSRLCATDMSSLDKPPQVEQVWPEPDLGISEDWIRGSTSLVNLGQGRFCIARVIQVFKEPDFPEAPLYFGPEFAVLAGVEIRRCCGEGTEEQQLQMVWHKVIRYVCGPRISWVL